MRGGRQARKRKYNTRRQRGGSGGISRLAGAALLASVASGVRMPLGVMSHGSSLSSYSAPVASPISSVVSPSVNPYAVSPISSVVSPSVYPYALHAAASPYPSATLSHSPESNHSYSILDSDAATSTNVTGINLSELTDRTAMARLITFREALNNYLLDPCGF